MRVEIDTKDLMSQLNEIGAGLTNEAVRPAAQAGAQVFYDMVRAKAPVSTEEHSTKGKKQTYQPGNLRNAVYQVFSEKQSADGYATYEISVNSEKAFYWRFVEFGTKRMSAKPFLRPSFYAAEEQAQKAAVQAYIEKAREVIQGAGKSKGKRRGT